MSAEEFAENRSFIIPAKGATIDKEAWKKFTEQNSPDIVKGYTMALADMMPQVWAVATETSDARKQQAALALYKHFEEVLLFHSELSASAAADVSKVEPPNPR